MAFTSAQLEQAWIKAGGPPAKAHLAAAIAGAESSFGANPYGDKGLGGSGYTSFGPWQIHTPAHPQYDPHRLVSDVNYAAKAAVEVSNHGTDFAPWTTYKTGAYRQYLGKGPSVASTAPAGPSKGLPPGLPSRTVPGVPQVSTNEEQGFNKLARVFRESGGGAFPFQPRGEAPAQGIPQASAPQRRVPAGPSGYVNPHPGFTQERTDMGVDFAGKPGAPIRAVGDAKVLGVAPNWYKGQPYVYYELLSGPRKGQVLYVAEQIHPTVKPGQHVRAGEPIGIYAGSGTGIEEGFGTRGTSTRAQATTGYSEGQRTKAGQEYEQFYKRLR